MIRISCPSMPDKDLFEDLLQDIFETKMLSNFGYYAEFFEKRIKTVADTKYCKLVSSCDIGLIITLKAFDLKPKSEILVPSFTFNSTGNAILWNNCVPRFVDVDSNGLNINVDDLQEKISKKSSAILATNTFGNPSDMKSLCEIAHDHKLPLIFDSAHAFGSQYLGKPIAKYGDAHVFSFSGTKIVSSCEGGAIVTPHKEIDRKIQYLRNYGFMKDYNSLHLGLNGKISELNALFGFLAIDKLNENLEMRKACYDRYYQLLNSLICYPQYISNGCTSTHPYYTLIFIYPDDLLKVQKALHKNQIETKHYYMPLHKMELFRKFKHDGLEGTDWVYPRILNLPIHTDMTMNDIDRIASIVLRALNGN